METKKISYDTLKDVLKPKQMRNILGGSGEWCLLQSSDGVCDGYCAHVGWTCEHSSKDDSSCVCVP